MEPKKSPKADLENKRGIFVQIGLLVSLAFVLFAFNYTKEVKKAESMGEIEMEEVEEEAIPITTATPPPPPPPPPPPAVVEMLTIVEDDVEIEDELDIMDSEADEETEVEVAPVVEEVEEAVAEEEVFFIVEEMPEFPGGQLALRKWIGKSVKYPVIAQENGLSGKVYINFVIGNDGKVTDAKVARGVAPSLDKEALRVVNSMPKWKPGKQRGKPVRVSYTVPINFVLQ